MNNTDEIIFVTSNENKFLEFKEIVKDRFNIKRECLELTEIQGEIEEVATKKCKEAYSMLQSPVIVEDTSLCFDALNGLPGPYIKDFLKKIGQYGLYKLLIGFDDFGAEAVCVFSYYDGKLEEPIILQGRKRGKIVAPRGPDKFGWDSVFVPENSDKSYAEMESGEKNAISHRFLALNKLSKYLETVTLGPSNTGLP